MKEEVKTKPLVPPGKIIIDNCYCQSSFIMNTLLGQVKNMILRMELHWKYEDEALIQDILAALTKKVENTLFNYCKGLFGKVPRSRDEYDPQPMISTLEHEEKILVFNSSRDLPQNWNDIDFQGLFGEHQDVGSEGPTSEAASVDNEMNIHIEDHPSQVFPLDEELKHSNAAPPRLLVFTTIMLLGFLTMCRKGSMDGTFKSSTRFWSQMFILMVE